MSEARARYWPGTAAGFHLDGLTVLVDTAANSPLAQRLSSLLDQGGGLEPLLDLLFDDGIAAAPDFVIVRPSPRGSAVVARGRGQVRTDAEGIVVGGSPFASRTVTFTNAVATLGDIPEGPTLRAFDGVLSVAAWKLTVGQDDAVALDGPRSGSEQLSADDETLRAPAQSEPMALSKAAVEPAPAVEQGRFREPDPTSEPEPASGPEPASDPSPSQSPEPVVAETTMPPAESASSVPPDGAAPTSVAAMSAHLPEAEEAEESAYLSTYRRLLQPEPQPAPPSMPSVAHRDAATSTPTPEVLASTIDGAPGVAPSPTLAPAPPQAAPKGTIRLEKSPLPSAPPPSATPGFIDAVPFGQPTGALDDLASMFGAQNPTPGADQAPSQTPFPDWTAVVDQPVDATTAPASSYGSSASGSTSVSSPPVAVPVVPVAAVDGHTVSRAAVPRSVPTQTVVAKRCPNGHLTQAHAPVCRVCAAPVPPQEDLVVGRPVLGRLVLPTGEVYALDRAVVLGRDPKVPAGMNGELPHLVRIVDPRQEISSQHAVISLDHWNIDLTDLGSTNGTELIADGRREHLVPKVATPLPLGGRIVLAEILEIRIEAAE